LCDGLASPPAAGRQLELVRHEGAHALAASLGMFPNYVELPLWLEEGMAQYCERLPFGQDDPHRRDLLREDWAGGRLIPWPDLMRIGAAARGSLSEPQLRLAYAQSWLLFRELMSGARRPHLFRFVLRQRQEPSLSVSEVGVTALLNELELTPHQLATELERQLAAPTAAASHGEFHSGATGLHSMLDRVTLR